MRAALLLLLALPAAAQDRTLRWDEIAVTAHLDAKGTLHVRERQVFVFTGDWNGGERSFRVGFSHRLGLEGIYRIGPDGREIPLTEGDLDQVDIYDWASNSTVRWRSRLPSDPPFQETPITYVLAYSLSGILTREGGVYLLDHDFSIPDTAWPIRRFTLDLDLDPAWQPLDPVPAHLEQHDLEPGRHVVVRSRLEHHGAVAAEPGVAVTPIALRRGLFAASLLAMVALYVVFRRGEARRGRFDPLPVPQEWNDEWLQENVLDLLPEEVGALWDQAIGPPEVAAVLARMVAEGKMTSEVRPGFTLLGFALTPGVLHLHLNADRRTLDGYERKLVDKLFFEGDDTDTDRVRQRYRSTGFNPASEIEKPLRSRLKEHGEVGTLPAPGRRRTLLLAMAVLALFALDAIPHPLQTLVLFCIVLFGVVWLTVAGEVAAAAWRKRTEQLDLASLSFLAPGLLIWIWCALAAFFREWSGVRSGLDPGVFASAALALTPVAVWSSLLNNARSRESDRTIQKRRLLGAARRLLQKELASAHPRLQDDWLPYLLAFGLGAQVDRWFRAFGGKTRGGGSISVPAGTSGGVGQSTWTGGGGSFGGAGATGAWAVAATGLASGVSAPSSSGGGGGGGGGGGSSGGGGGGGW